MVRYFTLQLSRTARAGVGSIIRLRFGKPNPRLASPAPAVTHLLTPKTYASSNSIFVGPGKRQIPTEAVRPLGVRFWGCGGRPDPPPTVAAPKRSPMAGTPILGVPDAL